MAARGADRKASELLAALVPGVATKLQEKDVKRGTLEVLSAVPYFHNAGTRTLTCHVRKDEKQVSSSDAKTLAALVAGEVDDKSAFRQVLCKCPCV